MSKPQALLIPSYWLCAQGSRFPGASTVPRTESTNTDRAGMSRQALRPHATFMPWTGLCGLTAHMLILVHKFLFLFTYPILIPTEYLNPHLNTLVLRKSEGSSKKES